MISPVNYVVSSNEDIFELIKADIIKDLFLDNKIDLLKLPEDNTLQKISNYFKDKSVVIGKFMLKFISKLSTSSEIPKEIIDSIASIFKDYIKESQDKKEAQTRSEELIEHWSTIEEKIGSIYEHNYISKVINTFLEELRKVKKNVLIIDDFDRIDPEHIFRILNILSAHNNHFESDNKFSFDHVILVCDLENIRRIYFHKYGAKVDFEGYIDKFYSTDIFYFTNYDAIKTYVKDYYKDDRETMADIELTVMAFNDLIDQNLLSVRKLMKHKYKTNTRKFVLYRQAGLQEDSFYMHQGIEFIHNSRNLFVDSNDLKILLFFKLMTYVFGDFNIFFEKLQKLKASKKKLKLKDCINLITFLGLQNHIASSLGDDLFFFKTQK